MLVLVGKGAAGKDTVLNRLCSKYGFKKMVTYTTRPMRPGEVNHKTYHFISEEEFKSKIESKFFLEYKSYIVANGDTWYYGSAIEDYKNADNKTAIILTPSGLLDLRYHLKDQNVKVVYIYANLKTVQERMKSRGDKEECKRRIEKDIEDFSGVLSMVDKIYYNNMGQDLDKLCKKIIEYVEEEE